MRRARTFTKGGLAPFFIFTSLFHLAAVATRFDELGARLPHVLIAAVFVVHPALILLAVLLESRIDYGERTVELPLWMRIESRPARLTFALAFTYLSIVVLDTWDIEIGPIDPRPPEEWPTADRARHFAIMTVGMFFPNYLAAMGFMVPALRALTAPLRRAPMWLGLLVVVAIGIPLGLAGLVLLMGGSWQQMLAVLGAGER